ncbi:MAG: hypothetical protein K9J81_02915 [Desulfohalobiaceae bacterium]|nr:hypothetical protein [Desulfohalobiaceae bacterium]
MLREETLIFNDIGATWRIGHRTLLSDLAERLFGFLRRRQKIKASKDTQKGTAPGDRGDLQEASA